MGLKLFDEPDQYGKTPNAKGMGKKPQVPRFMKKTGECNIRQDSKEKFERFISDFFTTMIDLPFSIFMLSYVSFYVFSWVIFSSVYYVDAKARGDIDYYQAREKLDRITHDFTNDEEMITRIRHFSKDELIEFSKNSSDPNDILDSTDIYYLRNLDQSWTNVSDRRYYWLVNDTSYARPVCFENVNSFKTAFLFFVETETTVGYGKRTITANCPEAILLLIIQCLAGTMVDAFMVGCIFIKISKPQNKNDTLIFSDNAVIAIRDGKYNFMFRIGNLRNSLFVKCICKVKFIKSKQTIEGEFLPLDQRDMDVGTATGADKLFLVTPMVIKHEINEKSPFWEMSCTDMMAEQFEIIVILEGVVESTGQSSQARTSYLNNEILWGHRFNPILSLGGATNEYSTDYSMFNKTYEVNMPTCSAQFTQLSKISANIPRPVSTHSSPQKFKKKAKGIMMVTKLMKSTSEDSHGNADISITADSPAQSPKFNKPAPSSRSAKLNKLLVEFG